MGISPDKFSVKYDNFGRVVQVSFADESQYGFAYDVMGTRTVATTVPASAPSSCCAPTVAALPKTQQGDFNNNAMVVLLSDGSLLGWGDNTTGVLANGILAATNAPMQPVLFDPNTPMPPFDATIVDWAMTNANLYVVFSNGWVYSAGQSDYGQLGHGDLVARPWLNRIEYFVKNYVSILKVWAVGGHFTTNGGGCAYFQASDLSMYACGENTAGNLGNASTPTSNVTIPAPCAGVPSAGPHVVDVTAASVSISFSAYMLMSDGTLMVAGYNTQGQLGVGTTTGVTGAFVHAQKTGATNITGLVKIIPNGGSTAQGNALALDQNGNVWTTGYNGHGELGLGTTTNASIFTQVTGLSNITDAGLGCGAFGVAYALDTSGTLRTWGYNGQNNLFLNNSTTPITSPQVVTLLPSNLSQIRMAKGNNLSTNAQLIACTTFGNEFVVFTGVSNGQIAVPSGFGTPSAFNVIPMPFQINSGTETIADFFVHGTSTTQRWFILTSLGRLYACGSNVDSICTGGISSESKSASCEWQQIVL